MTTLQKDQILGHRGHTLHARDGDKIGAIEEIYLDAATDQPEWALVNTGLFATERDGTLVVPFEKATVKDAPSMDANGQLTKKEEAELYRHYGRDRP